MLKRASAKILHSQPKRLVRFQTRYMGCAKSNGVFVFEEGQEHHLQIKEQIPVLDIIKVMADSFSQIGVATKTVHLSPAGDAGFHRMASIVMRDMVLEVPNQLRAFRARSDEAHFAFKHIPELRGFVDVPLPHKCANSKPARIVFRGPADFPILFRIKAHTANLQHIESLAIPAESPLAVEDRPRRFEIDQGTEDRHQRC